jgi:hypothetical protein
MEVFIMTNIKRRIASFVAAFAMVGVVAVPSVANFVTSDTAIVAEAAAKKSVPFRGDLKPNTNIRRNPSINSAIVASISAGTTGNAVYFTKKSKDNKGYNWYYSKYDKGWVREDRIK